MSGLLLPTLLKKRDVDSIIRDTLDKVLVLRFGRASDPICLQLDDILLKTAHEVSKFATIALVDIDSEEIQVYVKYFDISLIPSMIFFFNAHHMKMDSGTADHTKWIGAFHRKQDFIDVVEAIYRGAMKGKLIALEVSRDHCNKFQPPEGMVSVVQTSRDGNNKSSGTFTISNENAEWYLKDVEL